MQFVDPGLEGLFIISIIWFILSWSATVARIYTRVFMIKAFGWDDYFQLASMATFSTECLILIIRVCPQTRITSLVYLRELATWILASSSCYIATSLLLKISLALFFLRIVREPWQRHTIIWSTVLYTILGSVFLIVLEVQCANQFGIELSEIRKHCGNWVLLRPLNYMYASINAITDWTFALVPIYSVYKLQMSKAAKVTSCFLLGLGALASIASLARLGWIEGLDIGKQLFPSSAIGITSILELGITETACCLATLRPLFAQWFDSLKSKVGSRSNISFFSLDKKKKSGTGASRGNHSGRNTNSASQRGPFGASSSRTKEGIVAETEVAVQYETKDMV